MQSSAGHGAGAGHVAKSSSTAAHFINFGSEHSYSYDCQSQRQQLAAAAAGCPTRTFPRPTPPPPPAYRKQSLGRQPQLPKSKYGRISCTGAKNSKSLKQTNTANVSARHPQPAAATRPLPPTPLSSSSSYAGLHCSLARIGAHAAFKSSAKFMIYLTFLIDFFRASRQQQQQQQPPHNRAACERIMPGLQARNQAQTSLAVAPC